MKLVLCSVGIKQCVERNLMLFLEHEKYVEIKISTLFHFYEHNRVQHTKMQEVQFIG